MMDSYTGEVRVLPADHPFIDDPPEGQVIIRGAEEDVRRIAADVQRRHNRDQGKAKRKAQKAARKRNR